MYGVSHVHQVDARGTKKVEIEVVDIREVDVISFFLLLCDGLKRWMLRLRRTLLGLFVSKIPLNFFWGVLSDSLQLYSLLIGICAT